MKMSPSWLRLAASMISFAAKPLTKNRKRHTQNLFRVERCDERVLLAAGISDSNASTAAPAVLPNLRGSMFSISNPMGRSAGDVLSFSWRVQNLTTGAAAPFVSRIYMSYDPVITSSDRFLGEMADGFFGLPGLTNSTANWFVSLPGYNDSIWINGTATYYLGVIIDANQQVFESNEADNSSVGIGLDLASFQVTVSRPDLVGWIYPPTAELKPGDTLSLSTLVSNVASTAFGGLVRQSIYLSRDSVITTSDRLLLTTDTSVQLAANGSYLLSFSPTLPSRNDTFWSGDGNYYIGVIVDPDNQVLETNESNNSNRSQGIDVGTIQVTVTQPDLIASIVAPTGEFQPGDNLVLSTQVTNVWSKSFIGTLGYAMYLSRDSFIDSSDRLLFSGGIPLQIGPNGTYTIAYSTVLPSKDDAIWSIASTYYVGLILDPANQILESNELNNSNRGIGQDVQALSVNTISDLTRLPETGLPMGTVLKGIISLLQTRLSEAASAQTKMGSQLSKIASIPTSAAELKNLSSSIKSIGASLSNLLNGKVTSVTLAPGVVLDQTGLDQVERYLKYVFDNAGISASARFAAVVATGVDLKTLPLFKTFYEADKWRSDTISKINGAVDAVKNAPSKAVQWIASLFGKAGVEQATAQTSAKVVDEGGPLIADRLHELEQQIAPHSIEDQITAFGSDFIGTPPLFAIASDRIKALMRKNGQSIDRLEDQTINLQAWGQNQALLGTWVGSYDSPAGSGAISVIFRPAKTANRLSVTLSSDFFDGNGKLIGKTKGIGLGTMDADGVFRGTIETTNPGGVKLSGNIAWKLNENRLGGKVIDSTTAIWTFQSTKRN